MFNDRDRITLWWVGLDEPRRAQVAAAGRYLPDWVALSLANAGVAVGCLDPGIPGVPKQFLAPKALRTIAAEHRPGTILADA